MDEKNEKLEELLNALSHGEPDAHGIIAALEKIVAPLTFSAEDAVWGIIAGISGSMRELHFNQAAASCIQALGSEGASVDGRNEASAAICRRFCGKMVPDEHPEIGKQFIRLHHTHQQSIMSLFFCYLDIRSDIEDYLSKGLRSEIMALRELMGAYWWNMPYI